MRRPFLPSLPGIPNLPSFPGGASLDAMVAAIVASGTAAVWLDPSDLTTLFQESGGGYLPVTEAGQSVALALDKSRGLARGAELRGDGAVTTFGTPGTLGTYDPVTGAGSAYRLDGSNLSGVRIIVPDGCYAIDVEQFSGPLQVRSGLAGALLTPTVSGRQTYIVPAYGVDLFFTSGANAAGTSFIIHSVKQVLGNHARQSTFASRPIYQVDSGGRGYLSFDGTDDFLVTPTITPGTDKVQVFAGVRKLSDAATAMVAEFGPNASTNDGSFWLAAPVGNGRDDFNFESRGTIRVPVTRLGFAAPISCVLGAAGDIALPRTTLRVNGDGVSNVNSQGTGNYLAYPLYIGMRAGTSFPFNGRLYGLITRFGANLTADQISQTERWMAQRTGVTL